ncbi:MAG: B12-binding domain-containing radical SAM protein [Victivallaceae bacterium]|nr:B12-binding domain-containing radical SAM protein [Victivallaceae bacterium]
MADGKKVVFLELNSSYSHSMPGYAQLRALAEREAPEWQWGHVAATVKTPGPEIIREVEANGPDWLLATGYIFNLELLLEVGAELKKRHDRLQIFLGGPCFLGNNEAFLRRHAFIAGVMRGDESSLPDLLRGTDFGRVAGLGYLDEQNCYRDNRTAHYPGELDALPSPYQLGLIQGGKPFYQLATSRGCDGACTFCTSAATPGIRYHSLARVKADLQALQIAGYREIRLTDRTFNADSRRAAELLRMFREEFPELRFHLEIHPGRITPEILEQLAKTSRGRLHLEAGVQSFAPAVLKRIRRPAATAKTEAGLLELVGFGNLEVHTDLLAGLPGQTLNSLLRDVNKLLELAPDEIQLELLKLLPGTALRSQPPPGLEYSPEPPWQVTRTAEMSGEDLKTAALFARVLDCWYNPPPLRNVFRCCIRRQADCFIRFADFIAARCDFSRGRPALEKRFELLEEFLENRDKIGLELCRFARIAAGFRCRQADLRKNMRPAVETVIWSRPDWNENIPIKRSAVLMCDFNAGDLWLDANAPLHAAETGYIFKLHYGRNVAQISRFNPRG